MYYKVAMMQVRLTIVTVEKKLVLIILSVWF